MMTSNGGARGRVDPRRPGLRHSFWNASSEPARYLLVMTPRLHHLIEALHSGERTDYAAIFEEHDSELLS